MPKHQPSTGAVSNPVSPHAAGRTTAAILTKQQAAEYLQTTPRYVERMVSSGRLRALKPTGKLVRFRMSDLDAFLEAGASIAA